MATTVVMPKLGLLMTQGIVVEWLVAHGEWVEKDEPIVEIITEKITYQVVAPTAGVLNHMARAEDQILLGDPLAVITDRGETIPFPQVTLLAEHQSPRIPTTDRDVTVTRSDGQFVLASPWARHLAEQLNVNLSTLQGTGPDGAVIGRDVFAFREQERVRTAKLRLPQPAPREYAPMSAQTIPFSGMRRVIAQRMTNSLHTMAQATLSAEADVTELVKALKKQGDLAGITHVDYVIKAVALALKAHPRMNVVLFENEIEILEDVHIGLAVPLKEGLLVPVIRNADQRNLAEISGETRRLKQGALDSILTVDDVTGSTFTVTDLGVYGVDFFVPIINPPEAAILGVGRITEKPIVVKGKVAIRSMMMLCLAFDHRVIDGAPAARFLQAVVQLLANPKKLSAEGR
jgi:pyruvate dehydrogenase E2 component (dihydrolipoamide acetyltransferase)